MLVSTVMRRLFGWNGCGYFDDYITCEPRFTGVSGKECLHFIHRLLGIPLALGDKNVPYAPSMTFLGVVSDLSRITQGLALMRPKVARVAKIIITIQDALENGYIEHAVCASMCGNLEFVCWSSGYSRMGRAALAALHAWLSRPVNTNRKQSGTDTGSFTREFIEALRFFLQLLPIMVPRVFKLYRRPRRPIVVYTDAMYTPGARVPARIGVVIYDPEDGEHKWRHASAIVPDWLMRKFASRKQYIGVLETLAAVVAYTSRPRQFFQRDVIHFIDNTGALVGIAKGYSRDLDSSRLVHVFHSIAAACQTNAWFEYVPSAANIADLPSRDELSLLKEKGSEPFQASLRELIANRMRHVWLRWLPSVV